MLIELRSVDYSVGGPLLLDHIDLAIDAGERVCIVGRNGAGKSTLLKLIAGELRPDSGEVRVQAGLRIARLEQEVPRALGGSVFDVVSQGLGETGALLAEFHRLSHALDAPGAAARLAQVQAKIEAGHGWDIDGLVSRVLSRLELPEDAVFASLSGGMKRRVLLARALVLDPDVLLLDEPTNHLDLEAIEWLEQFLREQRASVVFVTHDRRFLRSLATRIVEIDRGALSSWPGDYDNYLRRREERANAEALENARFDKKLAQEEVWIRQGIKARRTRNEGRVRALEAMRRERAQRRERGGNANLAIGEAGASGRRVVEARDVSLSYGGRAIVRGLTTAVMRGDRIGIVGPNGSGKTTLLKLLLGELAPDSGTITLGTNLEIAYYDQNREQLRDDWTVLDNVSEGREYIEVGGVRKHALGYLQDFLFSPDRARAREGRADRTRTRSSRRATRCATRSTRGRSGCCSGGLQERRRLWRGGVRRRSCSCSMRWWCRCCGGRRGSARRGRRRSGWGFRLSLIPTPTTRSHRVGSDARKPPSTMPPAAQTM